MSATAAVEGTAPRREPGAAEVKSRLRAVELVLDAALAGLRNGTFHELVRQRPGLVRRLARHHGPVIRGSGGEAFDGADAEVHTARVLLCWLMTQLRPDLEPSFEGIHRDAWLNLTNWRPALAVMTHAGLVAVPEFRDRYRRRPDEASIDNLCGIWGVGVSTYYRYLERAKRAMAAQLIEPPPNVARRLTLRRMAVVDVLARTPADTADRRNDWHARQAVRALSRRDPCSALWHRLQAGDAAGFIATLTTHAAQLAGDAEVDALVERIASTELSTRQRFDLWLARAALFRTRNAPEREQQSYEKALQTAHAAGDRLLLGLAYGALGRFYEPRDADRAFACYQDSVDFLREVNLISGDDSVAEHYATTLIRLAWLYALRNDPRSKTVLDQAEQLRQQFSIAPEVAGLLEQTWGEYWRRAGDLSAALAHKHRALNLFERIGDQRSILVTYLNLSSLYGEARQFDRAIGYAQRILDVAQRHVVEPATLVSTHLTLGLNHFWQGQVDRAIAHYQTALELSGRSQLRVHAYRAHHNLAEAYFTRFRDAADTDDERRGDAHVQTLLAAPATEATPALIEATRGLKAQVMAAVKDESVNRLMPGEAAAHPAEMTAVERERAVLAVPGAPEQHVRARLALANAYLAISVKEREAARQLIERHQLGSRFASELGQLRETFNRELTLEQRLLASWKRDGADLLDDTRRAALIERLLRDGVINKSGYADVCAVSPATASKHLAALAERGLLEQTGKGPSTRYRLPP